MSHCALQNWQKCVYEGGQWCGEVKKGKANLVLNIEKNRRLGEKVLSFFQPPRNKM
jgi:hypothetical protein